MTDLRAQIEALRVMVGTDPYVRLSAALALIPKGSVLVTPRPGNRLVEVGPSLFDPEDPHYAELGWRTLDGRRLTVEWGEPDKQGIYELLLTATDDGSVLVTRETLAAVRDLCRMTGRYLAGDSDIEPQDVTAAIDEVHAALTPEPTDD
jgi:hypothetical protein